MPNSLGNTRRDVRKFCKRVGVKPTAANVEKMQREVTRTQSERDTLTRIHREIEGQRGVAGLRDSRGPVLPRIQERVRRELGR